MGRFKRKDLEAPLCECNCGEFTTWNKKYKRWNKFVHGHNARINNPMKDPVIAAKLKGDNNPMRNPEIAKKRSKQMLVLGNDHPSRRPEVVAKISKGIRALGDDHPKKTLEARKAQSKRTLALGENHNMKTPEARERVSEQMSGDNHPMWKGGIAAEPYCEIWLDKDYKNSILKRDNNECRNPDCWKTSEKLCGHHIDYNKKNCNPWNIITICLSCNSRANKDRGYWQELYQKIMTEKYGYNYDWQEGI